VVTSRSYAHSRFFIFYYYSKSPCEGIQTVRIVRKKNEHVNCNSTVQIDVGPTGMCSLHEIIFPTDKPRSNVSPFLFD